MAQNGKKSKKKRIIILSIIGVVLIALVAVVFLGSDRERVITVQTEKVEKRDRKSVV